MKKIILFNLFFVVSFYIYSQSHNFQYPAHNTVVSSSFYEDDTLLLNLTNSKNYIGVWGKSFLKQIKVYRQGINLVYTNYFSGIDSTTQIFNQGKFIKIDSFYTSIGSVYDYNSQSIDLVYSVNSSKMIDSLRTLAINGYSSFTFQDVQPHPLNDSAIIIYGSVEIDSIQKFAYSILEFNLIDESYDIHTDPCWFNSIIDLLYDKFQNKYIATSYRPLCNGLDSTYGNSYSFLDSNFDPTTPISDYVELHYTSYQVSNNNEFVSYLTAMEWVNDSSLMIVGNIDNPLTIPKPAASNSVLSGHDIGVSIRSASDFREIDSTKTYGIVDVAEVYHRPILKKIDSNLYLTASNLEFESSNWESWNTELALLGLDEQGNKHWMKYFPFNDYCWTRNIHPDENGGLWVVAQCEGLQLGQAAQFVKVMYIDSVAYWPRNGQSTGLAESHASWNNKFRIFPNPAKDQLNFQKFNYFMPYEVRLFDAFGREFMRFHWLENQKTISIADLAPGVYIYRIRDESGRMSSGKIVKEQK